MSPEGSSSRRSGGPVGWRCTRVGARTKVPGRSVEGGLRSASMETVAAGDGAVPALQLLRVSRSYGSKDTLVIALDEVSVAFEPGTRTAVMDPSGSGQVDVASLTAAQNVAMPLRVAGQRPSRGSVDEALTRSGSETAPGTAPGSSLVANSSAWPLPGR